MPPERPCAMVLSPIGRLRSALGLLLLIGSSASPAAATAPFTTLVRTGDPAPGGPGGANFTSLSPSTHNDSGEIAFHAGTTEYRFDGLFKRDADGALSLIARRDGPAPGAPGALFDYQFDFHQLDNAGGLAFTAGLTGLGVVTIGSFRNNRGIWGPGADGALSLIARAGYPAPGAPTGSVFEDFFNFVQLNESGAVAFHDFAFREDPAGHYYRPGIWKTDASGALALIAQDGDPAPGTPDGVSFSHFQQFALNDTGAIAFMSWIDGPGVTAENGLGMFGPDPSGALSLRLRTGDPAPGAGAGVQFARQSDPSSPNNVSLNNAGAVAFCAELTGPGVTEANDTGCWLSEPDGALRLAVREGDSVAGAAPGTTLGHFRHDLPPQFNDAGGMAFEVALAGPEVTSANDVGVLGPDSNGGIALLLRTGAAAPGLPAGVSLQRAGYYPLIESPILDAHGGVLVGFALSGPGITEANDTALFYANGPGSARLVVREGDLLEVSPGDHRTVAAFRLAGWEYSQNDLPINRERQLARRLFFTDGSEAIVRFDLPEPGVGSGLAWGIGTLALFARRRRSR